MNVTGRIQRAKDAVSAWTVPRTHGLCVHELATSVMAQVREDNIRAHAGNLAFRGLFSIFAALIVTMALLALFEARDLVESLLDRISPALPNTVLDAIREQVLATTRDSTQRALSIGTAASTLAALYGLSATARAVIDAMNTIYEVEERRPLVARVVTSLVMAVAVIALLLAALLLVVVGPQLASALGKALGQEAAMETLLTIVRWPVLLGFVLLAFALVYRYAPAAGGRLELATHGSIAGVVGWISFSLVFSVYVDNFGSFNATYGTLAGIAVLLLYMYFSSFMMLLGAQIDDVVRRHAAVAADPTTPGAAAQG